MKTLTELATDCPPSPGVYRLYRGTQLLHIGMAAGGATLQSEILSHAHGGYGRRTQEADRIEWEVVPDPVFAYRRFITLYSALTYAAETSDALIDTAISVSGRFSKL